MLTTSIEVLKSVSVINTPHVYMCVEFHIYVCTYVLTYVQYM